MIHFVGTPSDIIDRVLDTQAKVIRRDKISITTSGTTGVPKDVVQVASALNKKVGDKGERWVLCYSPFRWAGVSVINYCGLANCELFVPDSFSVKDIHLCAVVNNITHISLTPSLFKNILLFDSSRCFQNLKMEQITFGGEYCMQSTLDLAKRIFPEARVTHVYASTECGDICAASDGLEGYRKEKFSQFSLRDSGELVVRGVATGDIWRLNGERYYFEGRECEIINVGGHKVSPIIIEGESLKIGALSAKAYAVSNPIVGQLVALEYVGDVGVDAMREGLRNALPKYAWPVKIYKRDSILLTDAGKVKRT